MKSKKWLTLLILTLTSAVMAEAIPFRSGLILAAELSRKPQKIVDYEPADYPDLPKTNVLYAAVTLQLFPGRPLSRHDYSLHVFADRYPCVAIRVNNEPWKAVSGDIDYPERSKTYTMLFILDGKAGGLNAQEKYTLKSNYPPATAPGCTFYFKYLGEKNFSPAPQISDPQAAKK